MFFVYTCFETAHTVVVVVVDGFLLIRLHEALLDQ